MEVDAFFLADHVAAPPEGKFYVQGAGFTRVEVPVIPAPLNIGAVALIRVTQNEALESHQLRFTLFGPAKIPNVSPVEAITSPAVQIAEHLDGEEIFIQAAVMIPGVAVREGLHHVELTFDGELVRRIPVPVVVQPGDEDRLDSIADPGTRS